MRLTKKVALLSLVAVTSVFAGSMSLEGLIAKLNQTSDAGKRSELMREIDAKLAPLSEKERAAAIAKIKLSADQPQKPKGS